MRIGLIDLDKKNEKKPFPNIPLMKLSAYHKAQGDEVGWYDGTHCDVVYMSKVFSWSPDYPEAINADKVVRGGSGFAISLRDGKEVFDKDKDTSLPFEVEHIYPDYSLYGITDTAYGFCSRGCPRGCDFCHVKDKPSDGKCAHKVADLSEFWHGQKYIQLCDPNTLACKEWKDILQQLIDSKACVDFNQGVDIRLMTREKAEMLKQIKVESIHFAWDRYQDKATVQPKFELFQEVFGYKFCRSRVQCFVLTNFDTSFEQDLERVMWLRSKGINPYVMRYNKASLPKGHVLNALARWCNMRALFWKYETFEEYLKENRKGKIYGLETD